MTGYIFGPVPSRRLGRSLGVDLVPFKTCSFDCIYCQLGPTTHKTIERKPYAPVDEVIEELADSLQTVPVLDYVTLSGSGEPTLHSELGEVVHAIKDRTQVPVVLLTNGSLLWDEAVRRACAYADVVMPTLAAHNESLFQLIHRPAPDLSFEQHIAGLLALRRERSTPMWLELFLLEGCNATDEDLEVFVGLLERIQPERIQLNTAIRPTSEQQVLAVSSQKLRAWARRLGPRAEVISDKPSVRSDSSTAVEQDMLQLCRRRPSTLKEIAATLGLHSNEAVKHITGLLTAGLIRSTWRSNREYFFACELHRAREQQEEEEEEGEEEEED